MLHVSNIKTHLPMPGIGPPVLSNSHLSGHQNSPGVEATGAQDTGPSFWPVEPRLPSFFLPPSTQTSLWTPSGLGVWQPWLFSILLNVFLWGEGRSAYALRSLALRPFETKWKEQAINSKTFSSICDTTYFERQKLCFNSLSAVISLPGANE